MSFAKQYQDHLFYDLIQEAEKQGIALGVNVERERIIKLLFDEGKHSIYPSNGKQIFISNFERLTGCGCCAELDENWLKQLIKGDRSE